jgi:hypothetical protein
MAWTEIGGAVGLVVGAAVGLTIRARVVLAALGCVGGAVALGVIDPGSIPAAQVGDWKRNGTLVWAAAAGGMALAAWAAHRVAGPGRGRDDRPRAG